MPSIAEDVGSRTGDHEEDDEANEELEVAMVRGGGGVLCWSMVRVWSANGKRDEGCGGGGRALWEAGSRNGRNQRAGGREERLGFLVQTIPVWAPGGYALWIFFFFRIWIRALDEICTDTQH